VGAYDFRAMRDILQRLLRGEIGEDEALRLLQADRVEAVGEMARLDPDRERRKGVPEVVLAPGKEPALCAELALRLARRSGCALVSRVTPAHEGALAAAASGAGLEVDEFGRGRRLRSPSWTPAERPACVGVLAAGTSDVDVAEEARMVLETMGLGVRRAYDVGVSALHRLAEPLAAMVAEGAEAYVVVAGMEGALPSVVSGLVPAPVVAVPTSTGYGVGGRGLAALLAMLQSCAPGVSVVNVDNGIGAGATAGLIALRAALAREAQAEPAAPE